jgi:hypothetical protein
VVTALSSRAGVSRRVRVVSLLVFLTVFFLPLHFHPIAATAHVTKECSCIHGARTEMGAAPVQMDWTPAIREVFLESFEPQFFSSSVARLQSIRAPPAL